MNTLSKFYSTNFVKTKYILQNRVVLLGAKLIKKNSDLPNVEKLSDISYGRNKIQSLDILTPNDNNIKATVFYFHGGAWASGDKSLYTNYCERLCSHGYQVVNVNYRLIPEVSIKTCIADCEKAIRFIIKNAEEFKAVPNKIILMGDSAGAHLSSLIAGKLTTNKMRLNVRIIALGLYYGVYDFNNIHNDPSSIMRQFYRYFKSTETELKSFLFHVSPTSYLTKKFPPCFITCGKIDRLYSQTEWFLKELKGFDIETKALIYENSRRDAKHAFLNFSVRSCSKECFKEIVKFYDEKSKDV